MAKSPHTRKLLIGAHISIAKGFDQSIISAESIGCSTYQIFTKSNRQWTAKPISNEAIISFKKTLASSSIQAQHIIAHATYLINVGSSNKQLASASKKALGVELNRCGLLDIPYLVLHPGSHGTESQESCAERIAHNINDVLEVEKDTAVLLENMAGQGTAMGNTFQQLAQIYHHIQHKHRVGFCLDTCHAFASGYELNTEKGYEAMWQEFDNLLGIKKLKAIHVNDSKKGLGSRVDRHEEIGKGAIGLKSFELLINDERFFDIPKILETPKESLEDDKRNLNTLISLLSKKTKKILNIE